MAKLLLSVVCVMSAVNFYFSSINIKDESHRYAYQHTQLLLKYFCWSYGCCDDPDETHR